MVLKQANIFLVFILDGILIGILFDIFRVLRKNFRTPDIVTYIEDILFWILTGIILLYSIFIAADGEIRFYMFLATFCGCIFYILLFSKTFIKVASKILRILTNLFSKIFKLFSNFITLIIKIIKKIFIRPIQFIVINIKKITFFSKKRKDFKNKCRKI